MRANYYESSTKVYSYSTSILERHGGLTIGNMTYYSPTTSKHQAKAGSRQADVVLDSVPKGTDDLLALAVQRGLVETGLRYNHAEHGMTTPFVKLAIVIVALFAGMFAQVTPAHAQATGECTRILRNGMCANYWLVITEDSVGWQCWTMGNKVCGPGWTYYPTPH